MFAGCDCDLTVVGSLQTQSRSCALLPAAQREGKGKGKSGKEKDKGQRGRERGRVKGSLSMRRLNSKAGKDRIRAPTASSGLSSQEVFLVSDENSRLLGHLHCLRQYHHSLLKENLLPLPMQHPGIQEMILASLQDLVTCITIVLMQPENQLGMVFTGF